MAFNNLGVVVSVVELYIPDGYEIPSVTPFPTAGAATWDLVLSVDRDTVNNADRATTFGNILNDVTVGIKKQAEDIVKEWNDGSIDDVDMFVDFHQINTNVVRSKSNDFYTDADDAYLASVRIYAKIS